MAFSRNKVIEGCEPAVWGRGVGSLVGMGTAKGEGGGAAALGCPVALKHFRPGLDLVLLLYQW